MIQTIYDTLTADEQLMAMLSGGIHRAHQISRQRTPGAFNEYGELLPCALIKTESQTPWGPHHDSGRHYITLYLYQRNYDTSQPDATGLAQTGAEDINDTYIEMAAKRVYSLLHRVKLIPVDESIGCYDLRLAGELGGMMDQSLDAEMIQLRYQATIQRGE
jgi:hypothetical protein